MKQIEDGLDLGAVPSASTTSQVMRRLQTVSGLQPHPFEGIIWFLMGAKQDRQTG